MMSFLSYGVFLMITPRPQISVSQALRAHQLVTLVGVNAMSIPSLNVGRDESALVSLETDARRFHKEWQLMPRSDQATLNESINEQLKSLVRSVQIESSPQISPLSPNFHNFTAGTSPRLLAISLPIPSELSFALSEAQIHALKPFGQ